MLSNFIIREAAIFRRRITQKVKECIDNRKEIPYDTRTKSKQKSYYKIYRRTHMMSDHYPIWIELKTNLSSEYIERRAFKQ